MSDTKQWVTIFAGEDGVQIVGPFERWDDTVDVVRCDCRQNMRLSIISPNEYAEQRYAALKAAHAAREQEAT